MWCLESPLPDTETLDEHVDWLRGQVADKAEDLAALRADGYELDCFCFVSVLDGQGGVSLRPELLTGLGSLGIELGLDIYASSDNE